MSTTKAALDSINAPVKEILKELIKSAKHRKSKSLSALCEAYASIKVCPLTFTCVEELLPLAGFGEALVDQIEMQLCEWCEEHGKIYPKAKTVASTSKSVQKNTVYDVDEETDSDLDNRSPPKKAKGKAPSTKEKAIVEKPIKAKKAAAVKEPKSYTPQQRTGTSGILIALYSLTPIQPVKESEEAPEADAGIHYYSKATIIHFAQPYSDSKYIPKQSSAPSSGFGTNFHSAWGGMKTLINRGYVYRRGNPARFGLSHEGWSIAAVCSSREKDLQAGCNVKNLGSIPTTSSSNDKVSKKKTKTRTEVDAEEESMDEGGAHLAARQDDGPFLYTYLTDAIPPKQTTQRAEAAIRLDDADYRMMYRIAYASSFSAHPFVKKCVQQSTKEGSIMSGWVKDSVCNERAPGLPAGLSEKKTKDTTARSQKEGMKRPLQQIDNTSIDADSPEKALSQLTCSQMEVIELLTSSDVEIDGSISFKMAVTSRASQEQNRKKIDDGYDSDSSALSDLIPLKKTTRKRKAIKVS